MKGDNGVESEAEYDIVMATSYSSASFGPVDDEYMAMADPGDEVRIVGSLLRFYRGQPGGFIIHTATHTGRIAVTVRFSSASCPPAVDLSEWEDMAVSSVDVPGGELCAETSFGDGDTTPNLITSAGRYGVRVLAVGRDAPEVEDLNELAPDRYIVDVWPAPAEGVREEAFSRSAYGKNVETWDW